MSTLISKIHQDHVNMARILKLIASEIDALVAEEPRDLEVLDDAMRYMINYADKLHHPKEDIMFHRLQAVAPQTRDLVEDIFSEHQTIAKLGSEFHELVQAVEYGDFVLREEIIAKGREYVRTLYAHMSKEEEHLLKTAKQMLSSENHADLDIEADELVDPLFAEEVREEFKALYDYILRQYGDDWRHPAHSLV
jgi:hemerythrin-like domain-containing protein